MTAPLTPAEIATLRDLDAKRTPGEWVHEGGRMVRCKPNGDTVPARSTEDARWMVACSERDHLKRREESIIAAVAPVSDGGQYRADIVSAIERVKRERDEALAEVERLARERDEARVVAIELRRGEEERDAEIVRLKAPRMWQLGDPEPVNAAPYHMHASAIGHDPWATACGRRVPRAAIAYRAEHSDCPHCFDEMKIAERP